MRYEETVQSPLMSDLRDWVNGATHRDRKKRPALSVVIEILKQIIREFSVPTPGENTDDEHLKDHSQPKGEDEVKDSKKSEK